MSMTSTSRSDLAQCCGNRRGKLTIGQQCLRLAVIQHEGDSLRVESRVQRVQHGTGHRYAEMRFEHRRHIRRHDGDRVADPDATPNQRGSQPAATPINFAPGRFMVPVDDGDPCPGRPRPCGPGMTGVKAARNWPDFDPGRSRKDCCGSRLLRNLPRHSTTELGRLRAGQASPPIVSK